MYCDLTLQSTALKFRSLRSLTFLWKQTDSRSQKRAGENDWLCGEGTRLFPFFLSSFLSLAFKLHRGSTVLRQRREYNPGSPCPVQGAELPDQVRIKKKNKNLSISAAIEQALRPNLDILYNIIMTACSKMTTTEMTWFSNPLPPSHQWHFLSFIGQTFSNLPNTSVIPS